MLGTSLPPLTPSQNLEPLSSPVSHQYVPFTGSTEHLSHKPLRDTLFQDFKIYHFNKKKIDVNQIIIFDKEEFASIEPDIKSEMEKLVLLSHLKI